MKISPFFLLTAVYASGAYAGPPLPDLSYGAITTTDYSYQNNNLTATSQILDAITKLQNEVSLLKTNVANQSLAISDLKGRQAKLESLRTTVITNPQQQILGSSNLVVNQSGKSHDTASATEKSSYEAARALLNNGDNDQAITAFQKLITTYPGGAFADNSEYWMGEALLKKGDKTSAMQAFDRVVRLYNNSPKIPDALLKLGMTQTVIGNKVKAKEYYDYLIASYPGTPSASIAFTKRAGL